MNKQSTVFGFKSFLILAFCLLLSTAAFAATSEKNYQLLTKNLSKKIQTDLASENITVKLKRVEEFKVSKTQIGLTGDATAVLTDEQKPIRFEVKLNTANGTISDIVYDFVEAAADYNPTSSEEFLMKELMSQISRDYKTDNIVIAIDAFENVGATGAGNKFLGVGEVRVGDLVWNKIKFDVVLDAETQKASKVVYKIEK